MLIAQRVSVHPTRTGALLSASVAIMAAASVATHLIGAQELCQLVQDTTPVRDCMANPIPVTTDLIVVD